MAPHGGVVLVGEDASQGGRGTRSRAWSRSSGSSRPGSRRSSGGTCSRLPWPTRPGNAPRAVGPCPNPITSTSATGQPSTTFLPGSACRACGHSEVELELDAVDGSSLLLDEDATITAYGPDGDAVDAVPFGTVGSNARVWARYARTMGVDPVLLAGALAYAAIADADD